MFCALSCAVATAFSITIAAIDLQLAASAIRPGAAL
jgi:hypothetical protein